LENSEEYSFTINLFGKVFYETNLSELKKQRVIWKVFGVDYEAEKAKQQEIWDTFKAKGLEKNSPFIKQCRLMEKKLLRALIPPSKRHEYEQLKRAIYSHLRHRPDFKKRIDRALIEQAARLFADWLYIEEIMSLGPKEEVRKYADALVKIHSMLISVLEELHVTPKMRRKIVEDIQSDDQIMEKLKQLIGVKK